MASFHHRKLPDSSTLLAGPVPPDEVGFPSDRLQIWYNHAEEAWVDPLPHAHQDSDECFIILQGRVVVEVEGERFTIGPREFCCFPRGVYHQVVEVPPPSRNVHASSSGSQRQSVSAGIRLTASLPVKATGSSV